MLFDNATSHANSLLLTNMQICFLPKNTKSVLQLLDQGILPKHESALPEAFGKISAVKDR